MLSHPLQACVAVFDRSWVWVLGSEPVLDRHRDTAELLGVGLASHVILVNVAQDHAAPVDPVQAGQRPSTVGWAVDANHYIGVAVGSRYPAVLGAHLVAGRAPSLPSEHAATLQD